MTATNTIAKTRTNTKTSVDTRAEVAGGALVSINVAGAVIGLWSLARPGSPVTPVEEGKKQQSADAGRAK